MKTIARFLLIPCLLLLTSYCFPLQAQLFKSKAKTSNPQVEPEKEGIFDGLFGAKTKPAESQNQQKNTGPISFFKKKEKGETDAEMDAIKNRHQEAKREVRATRRERKAAEAREAAARARADAIKAEKRALKAESKANKADERAEKARQKAEEPAGNNSFWENLFGNN